jgi:hypothetical protein
MLPCSPGHGPNPTACSSGPLHTGSSSVSDQIIVQVQTLTTVIYPYIDQPLQQLIPPDVWMFLSMHKATVHHNGTSPDGIIGRELLTSMSILECLSISHSHVLDSFIGKIPQAWSGGNDAMSIDKLAHCYDQWYDDHHGWKYRWCFGWCETC